MGNKKDLETQREVTHKKREEFEKKLFLEFWEVSAKIGEGLEKLIEKLLEKKESYNNNSILYSQRKKAFDIILKAYEGKFKEREMNRGLFSKINQMKFNFTKNNDSSNDWYFKLFISNDNSAKYTYRLL